MSQAPAASTVASSSGWQTSPCDAVARFRIASLMLYLAVVPGRSCTTFTPTETVESAWVTWANSGAYDAKRDWQIQPGVYPRSYVRASSRLSYVPPFRRPDAFAKWPGRESRKVCHQADRDYSTFFRRSITIRYLSTIHGEKSLHVQRDVEFGR